MWCLSKSCVSFSRLVDVDQEIKLSDLAELPMVKDVVDAYNVATTYQERQRLLSFLSRQFTKKRIDTMGFERPVDRRQLHAARSHAAAFGAGSEAWRTTITRLRLRTNVVEAAMKFMASPSNLQQVAFGSKVRTWLYLTVPCLCAGVVDFAHSLGVASTHRLHTGFIIYVYSIDMYYVVWLFIHCDACRT